MCGISGEITWGGEPPDLAAVAAMTETMTARGPEIGRAHV